MLKNKYIGLSRVQSRRVRRNCYHCLFALFKKFDNLFRIVGFQLSHTTARHFRCLSLLLFINSKRKRRNVLKCFSVNDYSYDYYVVMPIVRQCSNPTNSFGIYELFHESLRVHSAPAILFVFGLNANSSTNMSSIRLR